MPGPQSTAFFILLMVVFGALIWWLIVAKHVVFRVLAACLAFVPAVAFGVAAVNKYYDYYQTWNSAISDFSGSGLPATTVVAGKNGSGAGISTVLNNAIYTQLAAEQGYTLQVTVHGKLSGISRQVLIYLPPQYFQAAYRDYRFPAIELIHGFPGQPSDWLTAMGVTQIYSQLLSSNQAKPAVLVIPDANGGRGVSLQCLNQVGGPQDATYLAQDLPSYLQRVLRIWPGRTWGVAGYSEGGYCAANLGVQYGSTFDVAGVMSGYFAPMKNQFPTGLVNPFGKNRALTNLNTPMKQFLAMPPGSQVAQFWIGAGQGNPGDVRLAELFRQVVSFRQPGAPLMIASGGHSMSTWRQQVGPMLVWMTQQLSAQVDAAMAREAKLAARHPAAGPAPAGPTTKLPPPGATPFPTKNGKSPAPKPSRA